VFVYAPTVEAVHLRAGKVARGGIRWSDRREDFRTEVLGLMKAQTVKNAVIVPTGAKGGFVVKRGEAVDCYRTFIRGLLDVTDTIAGGEVVPPADVVRHDDDDPYLVVAATRARRRSRTSRTRSRRSTASGSATRSPPAARPVTTTRRWGSRRAARGSR
jgi:glutamate dehydrogenase